MKVHYTAIAEEDMAYWHRHGRKNLARIETLIEDIKKHPFSGLGKPEPLKFQWTGYWSRRIDKTHRLVYKIHEETLFIVQCRYHY